MSSKAVERITMLGGTLHGNWRLSLVQLIHILALCFFCTVSIGCHGKSQGSADVSQSGHESTAETSSLNSLTHDFGLVMPGGKLVHNFSVLNPTNKPWKLEKIVEPCSCSVARASVKTSSQAKRDSSSLRIRFPQLPRINASRFRSTSPDRVIPLLL